MSHNQKSLSRWPPCMKFYFLSLIKRRNYQQSVDYCWIHVRFLTEKCLTLFNKKNDNDILYDISRTRGWMFVGFIWRYHCNQQMNWIDFGIDPNRFKVCFSSMASFTLALYFKIWILILIKQWWYCFSAKLFCKCLSQEHLHYKINIFILTT